MPNSHLTSLQTKHEKLEQKIHEEAKHAAADDQLIRKLKEEKLHIKEEIERLQKAAG